jgi:hypothetical protein
MLCAAQGSVSSHSADQCNRNEPWLLRNRSVKAKRSVASSSVNACVAFLLSIIDNMTAAQTRELLTGGMYGMACREGPAHEQVQAQRYIRGRLPSARCRPSAVVDVVGRSKIPV